MFTRKETHISCTCDIISHVTQKKRKITPSENDFPLEVEIQLLKLVQALTILKMNNLMRRVEHETLKFSFLCNSMLNI